MSRNSVRKSRHSRRLKRRMRGGDAWQHTVSVYGNSNNQHALPNGGNLIATNHMSGGDAWQHAQSVYGGVDGQHATPNGGNLIATNMTSGGAQSGGIFESLIGTANPTTPASAASTTPSFMFGSPNPAPAASTTPSFSFGTATPAPAASSTEPLVNSDMSEFKFVKPSPVAPAGEPATPVTVSPLTSTITSGGNGLVQVAVPGVLLVANQLKTGRSELSRSKRFRHSKKSKKVRKHRKSRH